MMGNTLGTPSGGRIVQPQLRLSAGCILQSFGKLPIDRGPAKSQFQYSANLTHGQFLIAVIKRVGHFNWKNH